MKKYLALILIFTLLIGTLAGCKKDVDTPATTEPTTSEDVYVRQEPQYHSKYFNVKMLVEQMNHTGAVDWEKENIKKIREEMDNGIIDTHILNGTLVFLTPTLAIQNLLQIFYTL